MKTATRPVLRRLLLIDQLIRTGKFPNASSAAKELEVHPRTVHRDLEFLRTAWSAPLEYCPQHNGYYYRDPDYALPVLRLTEGEMVALFLAEQLLRTYANTPYADQLASLFDKITSMLADEVTIDATHLADHFSFRYQKTPIEDAHLFATLTRAVKEGRQLRLTYWTASRGETTRRVVDPYHLASVQGDWYLIGYCHLREDVRMFVPGRIRSCKETGQTFERPGDFCPEQYLDHSFSTFRGDGQPQKVRVRFSAELARHVRDKEWHPSQKTQTCKDGRLMVTLKVNHLLEVKRWVMSYGRDCEVLEPEELRDEIRYDLEQMKNIYSG